MLPGNFVPIIRCELDELQVALEEQREGNRQQDEQARQQNRQQIKLFEHLIGRVENLAY